MATKRKLIPLTEKEYAGTSYHKPSRGESLAGAEILRDPNNPKMGRSPRDVGKREERRTSLARAARSVRGGSNVQDPDSGFEPTDWAKNKPDSDVVRGVLGKAAQSHQNIEKQRLKSVWRKEAQRLGMENSNMKYNHDKILAESASLTLSDLEQLQSAPGPVTERQKYGGNKGDIPDADREKKGHFGRGPKTRETAKEEGEIDFKNGNGLSGKQEDVMDTDKDGDIDAKDLKNLRGKKKGKKRQKYGGNKGDIPDADRKKKGRFGRGPKTRATAKEEGEIDFSHKRTLGDILSERRRGKPGTPKGEEHARDTEERTEIRQKHEDEVASSDGGPYVARDIKVGSYQPPIYGSGGSRRPKKKPGHKGDERRLSRLARHRRSLKKKK